MAEIVDYDYKPEVDGGKFLNLKKKGDSITIRIANKPISFFVHWKDKKPSICARKVDCKTCNFVYSSAEEAMDNKRKQVFAWGVIDRADGVAKIFKGGISIFQSIGEFANNPKWGDVTLYDLEITRTEISPANFYSVVPDPSSKGEELTKEEIAEVAKLDALLDFTTTQNRKDDENAPKGDEEVDEKDLPF